MIINGECLEEMRKMEDNSIDFIVTDPPYGLSFMNKDWDHTTPGIEIWKEVLRIAKPGSMLAAFGGTRTHHKLMCNLEDAGWEIRDVIMWIYGSGFPKSHNFGKKINGIWDGFGTTLKPAYEPIILAMKPLDGTFAQNAQKWGVAGINIDESRIEIDGGTKRSFQADYPKNEDGTEDRSKNWARIGHSTEKLNLGRWPANIILDEESAEKLDQQTGNLEKSTGGRSGNYDAYQGGFKKEYYHNMKPGYGDVGGASRFFYCAKPSPQERNKGLDGILRHPTVKPLSLMKYLLKLLAPPGDPVVLDPFAGSGSTLVAAKELGIEYIGIEVNSEYYEICKKRCI